MQADREQAPAEPPEISDIARLWPINELSPADQERLARKARLESLQVGTRLVGAEEHQWLVYLVSGKLEYRDGHGVVSTITGESPRALRPLFGEQGSGSDAVSCSPCRLVRIDRHLFEALQEGEVSTGVEVLLVDVEQQDNLLFDEIFAAYQDGTLDLPSLPDVAMEIRRTAEDPDTGPAEVAQLVESDPALVARLVQVANSAANRGAAPVAHAREAVTRLGLEAVRNLATSFAIQEVFRANSPLIEQQMLELHAHCVQIAALSSLIARDAEGLIPERALLAGLVHDIGAIPLLTYADQHPDIASDGAQVESVAVRLKALVGGMVLGQWGFDGELVRVAEEAEDWGRQHDHPADYSDVILCAQLIALREIEGNESLPTLENSPAAWKLKLAGPSVDSVEKVSLLLQSLAQLEAAIRA